MYYFGIVLYVCALDLCSGSWIYIGGPLYSRVLLYSLGVCLRSLSWTYICIFVTYVCFVCIVIWLWVSWIHIMGSCPIVMS